MSDSSRGDVGVLEHDSRSRSKELPLVMTHLEEAPFAEFCGDVVMVSHTPSIERTNPILWCYGVKT